MGLFQYYIPPTTLCFYAPERTELFIEGQASLRSYGSVYANPPPRPSLPSRLPLILTLPVCRQSSLYWRERGGGGGGREAESYNRKKAWPSINRSLLSAMHLGDYLLAHCTSRRGWAQLCSPPSILRQWWSLHLWKASMIVICIRHKKS